VQFWQIRQFGEDKTKQKVTKHQLVNKNELKFELSYESYGEL
jgi:hypothetical protein